MHNSKFIHKRKSQKPEAWSHTLSLVLYLESFFNSNGWKLQGGVGWRCRGGEDDLVQSLQRGQVRRERGGEADAAAGGVEENVGIRGGTVDSEKNHSKSYFTLVQNTPSLFTYIDPLS